MLSQLAKAPLRQGLRPLAALGARRTLCAPAVPLGEQISADIVDMKAKLEQKVSAEGYSPEELKAALEAGKVDTSMLNAAMANFSEPARKFALKLSLEAAKMKSEMATPPSLDWEAWEAKLSDPSIVAKIKAITEAELEKGTAALEKETPFAELEKEVDAAFNGAGGLFEKAAQEEKAAEAGLQQIVADMEKLQLDVDGIKNVTIAEILEREPELRAEIEEEIKNNVWAP